jgi:glycosyltransferase involved in cell wall biosynthesis
MKREISFKNDIIAYRKIKKLIKEFKPDIVHTHASKAGTLGRLAAYSCGVPVIVHTFHGHVFHSYFGKLKTTFYKNIERYLARKSTAIIAISEIQKEELVKEHRITKAEKVHIIPLGFDLSKFQENQEEKRKAFRKEYNLDEDEIAIVIIGRLVPVKNHQLFLEALKNVSNKSNKKIRAFIVGDGESRQSIELKAKELNIPFIDGTKSKEKSVLTFTSWIKNVDNVLAGSDIVALTSFNEGTPVSLIEAQAAGKAIVTTNVGGIENVVKPGVTALLADNNNLEQFTNQLLRLIEDEGLRNSMSKESWNFVREKYHYTRLVSDVENLYSSLLKKN